MTDSFWNSTWFGLLAGFGLGILASYLAGLINSHVLVSKLEFSDKIVRREFGNKTVIYQSAFKNIGWRKMTDIEIIVRIGIDGYLGAGGWAYHSIRTNASRVPEMGTGKESRRLVRLFDTRESLDFLDVPSQKIKEALTRCKSLEEVLEIKKDANIQVHVFGYDKVSGTKRLLSSKKYRKSDIEVGRFDGLNVVPDDKSADYN